MTISWELLEAEDEVAAVWREVGSGCGYATFFHTLEWAEVFCSAMLEWRPDPVVIEFADGNLAVLPMLRHLDSEQRQSMAPYVYGDHSVAWHSATHSDHLKSGASPYVYTEAIRAGCSEGLRWFDFNPSGHLRGAEFFKEGFRAERRRFDIYHTPSFTQSVDSRAAVFAEDVT
jgi:hypothetical protein